MRPTLPKALQRYQVQQEYILLETCRADEAAAASLAEILFALCNAEPEQAPPLIDKLETVLTGERYESLRELFMQWVNVSILTPAGVTPIDTTINFKEAREMLAARVREWEDKVRAEGFNSGIERGIEKGRSEGLLSVVLNMLKKKFSFDQIADATGFSVPEVKRLAAEHQLA